MRSGSSIGSGQTSTGRSTGRARLACRPAVRPCQPVDVRGQDGLQSPRAARSTRWSRRSTTTRSSQGTTASLQRKSVQSIIDLQLRRLPPIEDRLHDLRREQRQPQYPVDVGRVDALGPRQISSVACTPSSSKFRHRNACASTVTMAFSTRGRGAIPRRPASPPASARRFVTFMGDADVIVSRSAQNRRPNGQLLSVIPL